ETGAFPEGLREEVERHLKQLEQAAGKKFGSPENPLLVSVRSGAAVSMPGMMETILNLGLNDETVRGLLAGSGNPGFAYDSYRRFVQMYGDVVFDLGKEPFQQVLEEFKRRRDVERDIDLPQEDLEALVREFKAIVQAKRGVPFPDDPMAQLWRAIEAVFKSWNTRGSSARTGRCSGSRLKTLTRSSTRWWTRAPRSPWSQRVCRRLPAPRRAKRCSMPTRLRRWRNRGTGSSWCVPKRARRTSTASWRPQPCSRRAAG